MGVKLSEEQKKTIEEGLEEFKVVLRKLVGSTGLTYEFLRHYTAGLLSERIAALTSNPWNKWLSSRSPSEAGSEASQGWKNFKQQKNYKQKLQLESKAYVAQQTKQQRASEFKKLKMLWKRNVSNSS